MREQILAAVRGANQAYLEHFLARNPPELHAGMRADFERHMAEIAEYCLAGYGGAGTLTTGFIRGLHRRLFPPGYVQYAVNPQGERVVFMVPGEYRKACNNWCEVVAGHQLMGTLDERISELNVSLLAAADLSQKNTAILAFHLDFLAIRPFPDANARMAALIVDTLAVREGLVPYYLHSADHAMSMVTIEHRHKMASQFVKAIQRFGPRNVEVLGATYTVSEGVLNPKFSSTSEFMARHIAVTPESAVLDLGTGSGIQAITAARVARKVVAIDINPEAVRWARENVRRNGLESRVEVLEGDIFAPLPQDARFDLSRNTPQVTDPK